MPAARNYPLLLISQFLSAFGDNAILAVIVGQLTILMHKGELTEEALTSKSSFYSGLFFAAYILLAPVAGYFNDRHAKTTGLRTGNLLKLTGTLICMISVWGGYAWQAPGYFIVGIGGCLYGPAKYGILPELLPTRQLVKANGMVELLTLLAILTGAIAGSVIVDRLPVLPCYLILAGIYLGSTALNLLMTRTEAHPEVQFKSSLGAFTSHLRDLLHQPRLFRVLCGTTLFWVCGAAMKINFQPWGLHVLKLDNNTQIALLGLWLSVGVMIGSLLAGRLHLVGDLTWTRRYGFLLAGLIAVIYTVDPQHFGEIAALWRTGAWTQFGIYFLPMVIGMLIAVGIAAGLFLIPLNAALQAESDNTKLGKTIAVQNFADNLGMIGAALFIFGASKLHFDSSQIFLGLAIIVAGIVVWLRLPPGAARHD